MIARRISSIIAFAAITIGAALALRRWLSEQPTCNVLLITLDTTRADRLGCYGYGKARTPALDLLGNEGALFEHAYTVAPLTLPAHASLLTALYPRENGVVTNGRGKLPDDVPTLPETLRALGYRTGAFVGCVVLNRKYGLSRGFDTYDDGTPAHTAPTHGVLDPKRADAQRRGDELAVLAAAGPSRRPGERVVDAALAWL